MSSVKVYTARWVLTINEKKEILENSAVVVDGDTIIDILPAIEAAEKYKDAEQLSFPNHALLPGFINLHTHSGMACFRAISEGLALHDWLENCIWPTERQFVNEEFMKDSVEVGCFEMLRRGQTAINDMYFFPEVTSEVIERVGMRGCIGVPVIGFPTNYSTDGYESIKKARLLVEKYNGKNEHITISIAPHAPYTVNDDLFTESLAFANELNTKIHLHLHETKFETTSVDERPISRLDRLGVINDRLIAVHMTDLTDDEIELIAKKGVSVVHCPESNLKLGSGICNLNKLKKAGVNVAIGTDGVASNDDLDLLGELRTASLLNKYHTSITEPNLSHAIHSHYFLEMATINGARAIGMEHMIGSLEIGKKADFIAIEVLTDPVYQISMNLVSVGTNEITDVWIGGKRVIENKKNNVLDENVIREKARSWGTKIQNYLSQPSNF